METLKSKHAFEQVFFCGIKLQTTALRIRVAKKAKSDSTRVAFVAPKRLGCAVYRNRCKRLLREAARAVSIPTTGYDFILFATPSTYKQNPVEIARQLEDLLRRAMRKFS